MSPVPHPMERIREFFREIADSGAMQHKKGCFMGNTVVELTNTDRALSGRAVRRLERMEELFRHHITAAQRSGELQTREDPAILARYLQTMWNGLNITRRIHPDPAALRPLIELQLQILK